MYPGFELTSVDAQQARALRFEIEEFHTAYALSLIHI